MNNSKCPNCGTPLDEGAKFCTNCGTRINSNTIKEPVKPGRTPYRKTKTKEQGSNTMKYLIIGVIMLILVSGLWYLINPGILHSPGKKTVQAANILIDQVISTDDATVVITSGDSITLTLPIGLFEGEKRIMVKKSPEWQTQGFEAVYDITLENLHHFDNYIEITAGNFSTYKNGKLQAWHYSENEREWVPLPTWSGYNDGSAIIYTNHLSLFAFGFAEIPETETEPEKTIGPELPFMGNLSLTDSRNQIINIASRAEQSRADNPFGEFVLPSFGIHTSQSRRRSDPWSVPLIITDPFAYSYSEALSGISDRSGSWTDNRQQLMSAINSFQKLPRKVKEASAVKDVFTALFALDYLENQNVTPEYKSSYALDDAYLDFATTTPDGQKRNFAIWKRQIGHNLSQINDPALFGHAVSGFITNQFGDFITRNGNSAIVAEKLRERGELVSGNPTEMHLASVSDDFSKYLRNYLNPLIDDIGRDFMVKARIKLQEDAQQVRNDLNKRHHIHCKMKLNAVQKTINYAGSLIVFDVPEPLRPKWQGVMNSGETLDFYFTTAGYIEAGMPTRATLYLNQKNEKEIIAVDFQLQPGTTEIVFTPDDFAPVLGGRKVDVNKELQKQKQELDQIYKQLNR